MAASGDFRSHLVFWLKILLPVAALIILSTLFLVSRRIDTDGALPYAEVDVDALAREQRLTAPEYSGVTGDGAEFLVRAGVAKPLQSGGSLAEDVAAKLVTQGGLGIDMVAGSAELDPAEGRLALAGGVEITTTTGYVIESRGLNASTTRTELVSDGEVRATAPYGTLEAGAMTLTSSPDDPAAYVLVFNQGVKLVYEPES